MKTKQFFWGLFFITLGGLFLLDSYSSFYIDWYYISDFWPAIFILWGLIVILKDSKAKPILSGVAGITLAVILYSFFLNIFISLDAEFGDDDYVVSTYTEDWQEDVEFATLKVSGGIGKFVIKESSEKLLYARAKGYLGKYDFDTYFSENRAKLTLDQTRKHYSFLDFDDDFRNRLEVKLNDKVVWDLDLEIGAASTYLDLTDYKVRKLDLETGATRTKIKLNDKYEDTELDIHMGVASLDIDIPKESGCKISGDMVMIIKDLDGFEKISDHDSYYVTDNYDEAKNKIKIHIDGGVSKLKVTRK